MTDISTRDLINQGEALVEVVERDLARAGYAVLGPRKRHLITLAFGSMAGLTVPSLASNPIVQALTN